MERERRKRVRVGNEEVDAIQLTFQSAGENWNEYLTNDGSVLKLKTVATEIYRIIDRYDTEGNPQYVIKSANILTVSAPDNLRQQQG